MDSNMTVRAKSVVECTGVLNEDDVETIDGGLDENVTELTHANYRKIEVIWVQLVVFIYAHLAAVYGAYLMMTSARVYTAIFGKYSILPLRTSICRSPLWPVGNMD